MNHHRKPYRLLSYPIFTETQQKVLDLLYWQADRSFYTKEILRLSGMGVATIKRELDRMLDARILNMTRIGDQHHYQAILQCPIYDELISIVKKAFGVARVLQQVLEPLDAHVVEISIGNRFDAAYKVK